MDTTGCQNGKKELCTLHNVNFGVAHCICDPPFSLFTFPTERADADGRRRWIKLINRKDASSGKNWQPTETSRVCSRHVVDGRPTLQNPDPCLHLGYEVVMKPKRQPPKARSYVLPVKVAKTSHAQLPDAGILDAMPHSEEQIGRLDSLAAVTDETLVIEDAMETMTSSDLLSETPDDSEAATVMDDILRHKEDVAETAIGLAATLTSQDDPRIESCETLLDHSYIMPTNVTSVVVV
jgi:hypothetical protein